VKAHLREWRDLRCIYTAAEWYDQQLCRHVRHALFELGVQADEYDLYLHKGTLTAHLSPLALNVLRYAIQLKQAGLRRA
jgi:hypothetical protein